MISVGHFLWGTPLPGPSALFFAVTSKTTVFELSRLDELQDRQGLTFGLLAVGVLLMLWVAYWYRKDSASLRAPVTVLLLTLRLAAILGILVFFLRPEKRQDLQTRENSRVAVLIDVSQSMALPDADQESATAGPSRSEAVVEAMREGTLLNRLRETHDVDVVRFSDSTQRVLRLKRIDSDLDVADNPSDVVTEINPPSTAAAVAPAEAADGDAPQADIAWEEQLLPRGFQTSISQAIGEFVGPASGSTLAGVVLISDGRQTAGPEPDAAIALASERGIPISTIGVGSLQALQNARIVDVITPSRAQKAEGFALTAVLQSFGMQQATATVNVYRRESGATGATELRVASQAIEFGPDGDALQVRFILQEDVPQVVTYAVRLEEIQDDQTAADNERQLTVDIVDRKLRVLLLASGATREYRFVRNMLRRDGGVILDVLLQSSPAGISQDADQILVSFPDTRQSLFEYDAIIGFDPDWSQIEVGQVELLEAWVSEAAGGLILVAGPVHTAAMIDRVEYSQLRSLYPVVFRRGLTLLDDSRYGSETAWPIELTPEGRNAEFLQLTDDPGESLDLWSEFAGVYGYFAVRGVKPGATVYAEYSDPQAAIGGKLPPYFVGQFYGAGRVFYLASGEMWRIRALGTEYLDAFYTRLLRHVTQGRLLRGSARGLLMVEQDRYAVGDPVVIRAQVYDEQHQPLNRSRIDVQVVRPDHTVEVISLPVTEQDGIFQGQLQVLETGTFQLSLTPPGESTEPLSRRFEVTVPDLEQRDPSRDERLLQTIAVQTGGVYYPSLDLAVSGSEELPPLAAGITDRSEERLLRGTPNREFDQRLRTWLLAWIAGTLSLEWLVRRLNKLA